jgi:hypothetical protein
MCALVRETTQGLRYKSQFPFMDLLSLRRTQSVKAENAFALSISYIKLFGIPL